MATSDLRIGNLPRPVGRTMVPATYVEASVKAAATRTPFLLSVLKRRWYLLLFIVPLMGAAGYAAAEYFGKQTYKITTKLLYTGLPAPSGQQIYRPLDIASSELIIKSPGSLNHVAKLNGLNIPSFIFERMIEVKPNRSGVIELTFTWGDAQDCVKILNDISTHFIEQIATHRRETIDSFVPEVERNLGQTKATITQLNGRLQGLKDEIEITVDNTLVDYSAGITLLENAIDQAETQQQGMEARATALLASHKQLVKDAKQKLIDDTIAAYEKTLTHYAANHPDRPKIVNITKEIKALGAKIDDERSLTEWFDDILRRSGRWLAPEDLRTVAGVLNVESKLTSLEQEINSIQLNIGPKVSEIERLKLRLAAKRQEFTDKKAVALQKAVATNKSRDKMADLEKEIDELNVNRSQLQSQLTNLLQLRDTTVREYSVVTPPSLESAIVSSDKKKLFVGGFFLVGLVLIPPVLLVEWLARRDTPIEEAARVFSLPVLGQNLVHQEPLSETERLHEHDSVRLLSLRIQQSLCDGDTSVVLFSSLDRSEPAAGLVAEIGKCLAEREERVLLLDASGSQSSHEQIVRSLNQYPRLLLNGPTVSAPTHEVSLSVTKKCGLAEYLRRENATLDSLVQKSLDPQIDYLCAGEELFPKEGFATRRLTNLLLDCRKAYSSILVIGPTAYQNADLQMLAARVDGIIFTVGKEGRKNKAGYEALQELLELEAPILGVVG